LLKKFIARASLKSKNGIRTTLVRTKLVEQSSRRRYQDLNLAEGAGQDDLLLVFESLRQRELGIFVADVMLQSNKVKVYQVVVVPILRLEFTA
jgi:hypothetical protein